MRNSDGSIGIPPPWKRLVEAAFLELDPEKLQQRIEAAQRALSDRCEDLRHTGGLAESQALANAMDALRLRNMAQTEHKRDSRIA